MQTIEGFDFYPLVFDKDGKLESADEFDRFTERAADGQRCHLHRARLPQRCR